jgi:hypothetical protein
MCSGQTVAPSLKRAPACLAPHYAKQIEAAGSPIQRLQLYVRFGKEEMDDLDSYLDDIFGSENSVFRLFDEMIASSDCIWRGMIRELEAWEPANVEDKRKLKKIYKDLKQFRYVRCTVVLDKIEESLPDRVRYTPQIRPVCGLMAEAELLMQKRLGEPAPYDKR